MPCTAVYFRNRSTLASLSCSSRVSTAAGPRSPVIASTIAWRLSGDRDGAMMSSLSALVSAALVSADEVAAVDGQDVAVDVVRGPAGQKDGGAHQVSDLTPAPRRDVLDDAAIGVGIGSGRFGDRGLEVPGRDGVDLDVVAGQLVTVGLGEAREAGFGRSVGGRAAAAEEGEQRGDVDDL